MPFGRLNSAALAGAAIVPGLQGPDVSFPFESLIEDFGDAGRQEKQAYIVRKASDIQVIYFIKQLPN